MANKHKVVSLDTKPAHVLNQVAQSVTTAVVSGILLEFETRY